MHTYIGRTKVLTYWTFLVSTRRVQLRRAEKLQLRGLATGVFYTVFEIILLHCSGGVPRRSRLLGFYEGVGVSVRRNNGGAIRPRNNE